MSPQPDGHFHRRTIVLFATLMGAAAIVGCSDVVGPAKTPQVAVVVSIFEDGPKITLPDTARAGQPFTASIESYGNGCVRVGRTDVAVVSRGAVLTPLNVAATEGPCEDMEFILLHEVRVSLTSVGTNTVTVRGREVPGGPILAFPRQIWVK